MKEEKGDNNNNNNNYNSGSRVMLCTTKEFLKEERRARCCFSIFPKNLSSEEKKNDITIKVSELLMSLRRLFLMSYEKDCHL
jgi:hypothetical protein